MSYLVRSLGALTVAHAGASVASPVVKRTDTGGIQPGTFRDQSGSVYIWWCPDDPATKCRWRRATAAEAVASQSPNALWYPPPDSTPRPCSPEGQRRRDYRGDKNADMMCFQGVWVKVGDLERCRKDDKECLARLKAWARAENRLTYDDLTAAANELAAQQAQQAAAEQAALEPAARKRKLILYSLLGAGVLGAIAIVVKKKR